MRKKLSAFLLVGALLISNLSVYASEESLSENNIHQESGETEELEDVNELEDDITIEEDDIEEEMDERSEALVDSYYDLLGSMAATYASGDTYATELAKFPKDYQTLLKALHKTHPNWIFKAVDTGLEWDDVVAGESYGTRSLTYKTYSDILLSKASGDYDTSTGKYIPKDGSSWVNVSDLGVAYFVDPRNYLNEEYIFAMEYLGYDQNSHTLSGVESILSLTKTELANKQISYVNTSGKTVKVSPEMTYGEAFLAAGIKNGISPLSLAARMKQETGGSLKYGGLSGNYSYNGKSYTGYYNYYNIGSTADTSKPPLVNGLEYAKKVGWTSPMLAIDGGAQFMASGYIAKGQNTLYFQKFNTVYKPYYSHQYMQNITAPMSEGNTTYKTYKEMGIIDSSFVFYIPVYKNMPSHTSTVTISKTVKTAKVVGGVNLRTGPATTYSSLLFIPAGETVTVQGGVFTDDTVAYGQKLANPYWLKVTYGKYTGYISSNYFKMDTSITINKGGTSTLKLSSAPSGENIYYETSDPRVATVSSKGVVTGVGAGTCMIYAVTSSGQALDVVGFSVLEKLETPTLNSATNTKSGIKVSWSKIAGAEGYYVYRKSDGSGWSKIKTVTSGTSTSYVDTSVKSNIKYTYTVKAYAGSTKSNYESKGISALRLEEPQLSITEMNTDFVKVKWTKTEGAEGYYVYRREGTSGGWTRIAEIKEGESRSYTYKESNKAAEEYFTVKAYNGSFTSSYATPGTLARMVLATPKLSSVKNTKSGISVTWNKVSNAEGYYVYRRVTGEEWKKVATIKDRDTISYLDTSVKSGNHYIYTLRAYHGNNLSGYENSGIALTRLAEPNVSVVSFDEESVNLKWSKITGAEGYYVYRRVGTSGEWTRIATIKDNNSTTYTYTGKHTSSTKEYFTVKAYNGSVVGSYATPGIFARVAIPTPSLVSVKNEKNDILLTWKKVSVAEGYYIYRRVSGGNWTRIAKINSVEQVTYKDKDVKSGVIYNYTVRGFVENNLSGYDVSGIEICRLEEPTMTISNIGDKSVTVKWTKVSGAEGYYIYRRVGTSGDWTRIATVKNANTLDYTYQGTHATTTKEYFTVKAYSKKDVGSYASPGTFARVKVKKPQLSTIQNNKSGVKVTWNKVTSAEGYKVYRKVSGGKWKCVANVGSGTTVSYVDQTAKSGTAYIYTVRAYIGQNLSSYDSAGLKILYLSEPTVKISDVTANSVKVDWSKISGAKGYYVYHRSGTTGDWKKVATIKSGNTTSCEITGLTKATKYYFTVKAYNGSTYSSYQSEGVSVTTGSVSYTTYKTTDGVNYRTGPGTSYSKAGTLASGTKVQVENGYAKSANGYTWYRVKIGSKNYYIVSKYLKKA